MTKGRLFEETASGVRADRRELTRLTALLRAGDVVLVTRLDRLARSTRDLLNVLATIGESSASFKSIADSWADTTTPHGRLMLTVLGGLAEFERELIAPARAKGTCAPGSAGCIWAAPDKLTSHQQAEALIAQSYNVPRSTISRLQP